MSKARYEVCGEFPIVDVAGHDVPPGEIVELDDTKTNVIALMQAALVRPAGKKPAAKAGTES